MLDNQQSSRSRDFGRRSEVRTRPDEAALYARRLVGLQRAGREEVAQVQVPADDIIFTPVPLTVQQARPRPTNYTAPSQTSSVDGMFVRKPQVDVTPASPVAPVVLPAVDTPVRTPQMVQAAKQAPETKKVAKADKADRKKAKKQKVSKHVQKEADEKKPRRSGLFKYAGAAVMAMVVMAFTGYVSIDTWVTNNNVKAAAEQQASKSSTAQATVMAEGEDESDVKESAVDEYQVTPDLPRVLTINSLNIKARILPMSVNSNGSIQAPVNIFDSGWYGSSVKPGEKGAMFIDGHASGASRKGLFAYLDTMKKGDVVSVERGDGQKFDYKVVYTEVVDKDTFDMSKALKPYGTGKEGLNIMTCTGTWIPSEKTYDHRVMVYTERI